ncbi:1,2-phenylacetyl-CoA epoxidase subunit PaaD [Nocardia panacis]|uniref:1,2-phenylacetyl-CoA epoxidase subunit PaaD n=1 Tax=Nocardia panacis TaxID=2340916 RepID=UPI003F6F6E30
MTATDPAAARAVVESVLDPEMPMLTIADLGVLRDVQVSDAGVVVRITPTYSGCPAMGAIRLDIESALRVHGFTEVRVDTVLAPAWSSDWITPEGRRKLRENGYSEPGPAPRPTAGPIALTLLPPARAIRCPRCDSPETELISEFSATACKALYRCRACLEPFDHVKEI